MLLAAKGQRHLGLRPIPERQEIGGSLLVINERERRRRAEKILAYPLNSSRHFLRGDDDVRTRA